MSHANESKIDTGATKWSLALAFLLGCCVLSAWTVLSDNAEALVPAPQDNAIDYRDIAAELVARGESSQEAVVEYRSYNLRMAASDFDTLCEAVEATQSSPSATISETVRSFLISASTNREAWAGTCSLSAGTWLDRKVRIEGEDTAAEHAAAIAEAGGTETLSPVSLAVRYFTCGELKVIESRGGTPTLFIRPIDSPSSPLSSFDNTLAQWQDAIDFGANVPGQSIHGLVDGHRQSIRYAHSDGQGGESFVDYRFNADQGWSPIDVIGSPRNGVPSIRIEYGYGPSSGDGAIRPCVVLNGRPDGDGAIRVTAFIIDGWTESCPPDCLNFYAPPFRHEIVLSSEIGAEVLSSVIIEPASIVGESSEETCQNAILHVVTAMGTEEPDADFNYDGVVDSSDLTAVLRIYGDTE